MGTVSFDGVRFQVYTHDHLPPHVHGKYGSAKIVVEIADENAIRLRATSKRPRKAKRSDVRKILESAAHNYLVLIRLWEATHGSISR